MFTLDTGDATITIESFYGFNIELENREFLKEFLDGGPVDILSAWHESAELEEKIQEFEEKEWEINRLLRQLDKSVKSVENDSDKTEIISIVKDFIQSLRSTI